MPKLVPLSSKQMKEMGLVKTPKGFMIQAPKAVPFKKEVVKKQNNKIEKHSERRVPPEKIRVREPREQRVIVSTISSKQHKSEENKRLGDRGIY